MAAHGWPDRYGARNIASATAERPGQASENRHRLEFQMRDAYNYEIMSISDLIDIRLAYLSSHIFAITAWLGNCKNSIRVSV